MLLVSKKWERLRTGLWGYKVAKKVSWKCGTPVFKVENSSESCVRDTVPTLHSRVGCAGALLWGNFTEGERGAGCASAKRSADVSCEPEI